MKMIAVAGLGVGRRWRGEGGGGRPLSPLWVESTCFPGAVGEETWVDVKGNRRSSSFRVQGERKEEF